MNPRPLGPEPSALPTALHPVKKNRSSWAAAVWLGMRGSNSHGRSQSPLHYHYANPHRICVLGVCPQRSYIIACPVGFVNAFFKKTFTFFVLFRFRRCFAFFHGNTIRWELCGVALGFVHQLAGHMLRGKRQTQHAGTSGGHFLGKIIVIVGKLAAELPANFCLPRGRASPAGCYSRHISRCRSWNGRHIFLIGRTFCKNRRLLSAAQFPAEAATEFFRWLLFTAQFAIFSARCGVVVQRTF